MQLGLEGGAVVDGLWPSIRALEDGASVAARLQLGRSAGRALSAVQRRGDAPRLHRQRFAKPVAHLRLYSCIPVLLYSCTPVLLYVTAL